MQGSLQTWWHSGQRFQFLFHQTRQFCFLRVWESFRCLLENPRAEPSYKPYINRCVAFQITSNQLSLPQVVSNQVVEISERWSAETGYNWFQFWVSKSEYFVKLFLIILQEFKTNFFTLSLWSTVCKTLRSKINLILIHSGIKLKHKMWNKWPAVNTFQRSPALLSP